MHGRKAADALDGILLGDLGLALLPAALLQATRARLHKPPLRIGPGARALSITVVMLLFFCAVPYLLPSLALPPRLIQLQIYGALWAGWATFSSTLASAAVTRIAKHDIIARLTPEADSALAAALERGYAPGPLKLRAWLIGAAAAAAAGYLVSLDDGPQTPTPFAIIWWSVGWAILFSSAARVVQTATFYRLLPRYIGWNEELKFRLDPANTQSVWAMTSIARTLLLFWIGIAISIALVIPATVDWLNFDTAVAWPGLQTFVLLHLLVTGFFSLAPSVFVFLTVEADVRAATRHQRWATLVPVERASNIYLARIGDGEEIAESDIKKLNELRALHAGLSSAPSYRSMILSGLSVLVPFVPLLGLLLK